LSTVLYMALTEVHRVHGDRAAFKPYPIKRVFIKRINS
jgi:hypothetical protein